MHLCRLELTDVRSYAHVTVQLESGVTVFVGANGHGKTNLLEAIQRAAVGTSHRVASDGPLIRAGAERAVIRCELRTDRDRRRTVELELAPGRRGRTRVDRQDVHRSGEAIGVVRAVLFAPEDVAIVRGDPRERRRFLDDLLAQRRPAYDAARTEYERTLRQRNHLLRQARGLSNTARATATATLDVWTDQLVSFGTQLVAARLAAVRALGGPVDRIYRELADRPESVAVGYRSSAGDLDSLADRPPDSSSADANGAMVPDPRPIAERMRHALSEVAADELARGVTLIGPHRDDLDLAIGALSARSHASQGEAWSLALALKLASFELLEETGDRPILLLDDVFAELDTTRRTRLAAACDRFDQVLVTAAVEADVPLDGRHVDVVFDGAASQLHDRPTGSEGAA